MYSIDHVRHLTSKILILFLWAQIPILALVGMVRSVAFGFETATVGAIALVVTLYSYFKKEDKSCEYLIAVAIPLVPALMVYMLEGQTWQLDAHMYFFASMSLLIGYCDWRPIILATVTIALHHLILNYTYVAAVFPDGADLLRVIFHAAVVLLEAGVLIWVAKMLERTIIGADMASRAKSDFLANMSHELRTPLNGIIGMVQLLRADKLDADSKETFELIEISSKNLLDIVNDILDLAKIEARQVDLEHAVFNVTKKIENTANSLRSLAKQKGLDFVCNSPEMGAFVKGDELRFGRVLINILSNAIRYTDSGSITLTTEIRTRDDGFIEVLCTVKDTGIGIAADKIDRIFEKFVQADSSTTRKYGGTGLGLTITKQLVEMMNGQIGVHSELGQGSTFWFSIPFEMASAEKIHEGEDDALNANDHHNHAAVPLSSAKFLLVEDHPMNQMFMKKLFQNLKIENYVIAENGKAAIDLILQQDFDIILMDCHMPEMNGYEATDRIRNLSDERKKSTPIIAMTANAMKEDEEYCLKIGMNDYISKPVDIGVFKAKISKWVKLEDAEN